MQKHREPSPVGIILYSTLVTCVVLAVLSYFAINRFIPSFNLSSETLYFILIRLLPITIGIVLVLIALVLAPPKVPRDTDEQDMLEKDTYIAPLFNLPVEEEDVTPQRKTGPYIPDGIAQKREREVPPSSSALEIKEFSGKPKSGPDMVGRELPTELKVLSTDVFEEDHALFDEEKPPVSESETAPSQMEISRELPPQMIETPVAETSLEHTPRAGRLSRAVLFEEYPYPVQGGTDIAKLLEPIGETDADEEIPQAYALTIEDSFDSRLESELEQAQELGYELTVARLLIPSGERDPHSVDATVVQSLFNKLGIVSFFYLTDTRQVSAIFPFHGFEQARRGLASMLESLRKQYPDTSVTVGFSALGNRPLTSDQLLGEAQIAADIAAERGGYSLIGYDVQLESETEA